MEHGALPVLLSVWHAYGGDFEAIQRMTARQVIQALAYKGFLTDYENAAREINK